MENSKSQEKQNKRQAHKLMDATPGKKYVRTFLKELSCGLLEEDTTLIGRETKVVGGERPSIITLQSIDVLLEPVFWLVFHSERKTTVVDLRDDLGVPGRITLGFLHAFREHFKIEGSVTPWQEAPIESLLTHMRMLALPTI